ncbi:MAG: FprA family A-type flavoprotein [Solobacterium sp.]|jgi:flavorubredoxin|nr:FprA family A-type flavoprotein [Solobacterium sp.]MCH4222452.1 FprA family A-type flavoprotein [Solobacterium sp.]MCH4265846.1 FprA family A-type flavoprotein [Solobacterium sp.]
MESIKLKENLYWVGMRDFDLKVFDVIVPTDYGTTYNSYILKGSEKTALFETVEGRFLDRYIPEIEEVVPVSKIDYLIQNHTEPDHCDGISKIIDLNPDITVVGTAMAINNLKEIMNRTDFKTMIVKDKETLSLGDITLEFESVPNLHWPDTMWTYAKELKTLFTCDGFGCHFAVQDILRSKVTDEEGYWKAEKLYFDCIMGPFKNPFVLNALKRFDTLDVDYVCPGHGPVLDSHISDVVDAYRKWSVEKMFSKPTVIIAYASAYGYTKMAAEAISDGIHSAGDIDVKLVDLQTADLGDTVNMINDADGFLVGSPTIVGDALPPVWNLLGNLHATIVKGKYAAAFGSYGWSGEAVGNLTVRLNQLKLNVLDGYKVKFRPSESQLSEAKEYGAAFGRKVITHE